MTTVAVVGGAIPLVMAGGAGAQSRHALGIVISCGMLIGTLFTLFIIPVIYTFFSKQSSVLTNDRV